MTRGRFIAFEGGEGMGKSTQARMLAESLRESGLTVTLTREPGGTPGAEAIRELLLAPPGAGWTMEAEALLFAAARADHVAHSIRPSLDGGGWVICDRFIDSSRAYQGVAGGMGDDEIMGLHAFGSAGLMPDLTIMIEAPQDIVSARLAERDGDNSDAIGGRTSAYHAAVNEAFRDLASREPARFAIVDGAGSIEDVHRRVLSEVARRLGASE
ncbi:dTMP kinase [Qipengyuania flava]|uniref:dTMP kinase n=1 Tax=Qipengyuania flava TaxID=192812 RepID=UPI001C5958C2|nr:dTMP kinase [Qipengyuania flava]MBW3168414.1 dTMP kinase [Qipengyuania flava]MBY5965652.1 dTMP kinase [Qipengyuania flava]MBY6011976.1 dTMP kinase [Qipengyuania flava]MBY6026418.1 dTMP kinase [Qipengyuania flava]